MAEKLFLGEKSKGRVDDAFASYIQRHCSKIHGQYCNCDLTDVCKEGKITNYVKVEELLISAGFLTELTK
jgi:hypothetical protein